MEFHNHHYYFVLVEPIAFDDEKNRAAGEEPAQEWRKSIIKKER